MAQPIPELHGSGILPFDRDLETDEQRSREILIRRFLPLAMAIHDDPIHYAQFMTDYVGDPSPVMRGFGARPEMVRIHEGEEIEYPCEVFSGASLQGDLVHVRAAVWASKVSDYRVALTDGDHSAQEPHLMRLTGTDPTSAYGLRLGMMDARTRKNWPPEMVPDRRYQWLLTVQGEEPETREAVLQTLKHTITFYPIEALHAAILRVADAPPQAGGDRRLSLVHSDAWG